MKNSELDMKDRPWIEDVIGYAWFFENMVIYGDTSDLLSVLGRGRKRTGKFLGVVKGAVPHGNVYCIYQWIKHDPRYIQRQKERAFRRKKGLTRLMMRDQKKMTEWCEDKMRIKVEKVERISGEDMMKDHLKLLLRTRKISAWNINFYEVSIDRDFFSSKFQVKL